MDFAGRKIANSTSRLPNILSFVANFSSDELIIFTFLRIQMYFLHARNDTD